MQLCRSILLFSSLLVAVCVAAPRQYGLYEACTDSACSQACTNNTLYINRCVYNPELNSALMNACNGSSLLQLFYNGQEDCSGTPQVTVIPLNRCLEGPFDNSLKYWCANTPFVPPPASQYGQTVTCPSSVASCDSFAECDYTWFTPSACEPNPFGSQVPSPLCGVRLFCSHDLICL